MEKHDRETLALLLEIQAFLCDPRETERKVKEYLPHLNFDEGFVDYCLDRAAALRGGYTQYYYNPHRINESNEEMTDDEQDFVAEILDRIERILVTLPNITLSDEDKTFYSSILDFEGFDTGERNYYMNYLFSKYGYPHVKASYDKNKKPLEPATQNTVDTYEGLITDLENILYNQQNSSGIAP